MTRTLTERLATIDQKIRKMAQKFEIIRKENMLLIEENITLKQQMNNIKKNKNLNVDIGLPVTAESTTEEVTKSNVNQAGIRKELDNYIKEVQECIDQLQTL